MSKPDHVVDVTVTTTDVQTNDTLNFFHRHEEGDSEFVQDTRKIVAEVLDRLTNTVFDSPHVRHIIEIVEENNNLPQQPQETQCP